MRHTFKVLFYIKRKNPLRSGLVPVMGRITINGQVAQFATRVAVPADSWDVKLGRLAGRSALARQTNAQIERIRYQIEKSYERLCGEEGYATASMVKNHYLGEHLRLDSLLTFFRRHNEAFEKMVGVSRSRNTYIKYLCVAGHLASFIRTRYGREDIGFQELDNTFVVEFEAYLRCTMRCRKNTTWIYMIAFKRILSQARGEGLLARDPFGGYKPRREVTHRCYLNMEEVMRIIALQGLGPRQEFVRDVFVFSCFTGLAYSDLKRLSWNQVQVTDERQYWVSVVRQKTGVALSVRLFSLPVAILLKYASNRRGERIFDLPSNAWCNVCLERIMAQCGIAKKVTFHVARHTFATTVTLSQGVPIETIGKLLGHKNIRTTQIYATVTHAKLTEEMEELSKRIDPLCVCQLCEKEGKNSKISL